MNFLNHFKFVHKIIYVQTFHKPKQHRINQDLLTLSNMSFYMKRNWFLYETQHWTEIG